MSKRTEQEINDIAKKMILRVLDMKPGERAAVVGLVEEIEPSILDEDSSIMPGGLMFDITDAFFELALDEDDLLLDMSEHDLKKKACPLS